MTQSIEATGPDIESAVAEAAAQLGVTPDRVQVEVLEEPVRRLLGLGLRPARVRVTVIGTVAGDVPRPSPAVQPVSPAPVAESKPAATVEAEPVAEPKPKPTPEPPRWNATRSAHEPVPEGSEAAVYVHENAPEAVSEAVHQAAAPSAEGLPAPGAEQAQLSEEQPDNDAQTAADVLRNLLGFLSIEGAVTVRHAETDGREARHWLLEIQGDDMAALIGNKGETLAALQYLTRLIVSRKIGHHANLVIDVAGYKSHREEMLKRLAKRMAGQAVELKRTVTLEPMPPHERRIVHLTLRDHPSVTTESVGEGDKRKVTIIPRRNNER